MCVNLTLANPSARVRYVLFEACFVQVRLVLKQIGFDVAAAL